QGMATVPRRKLTLPLPRAPAVVGQEPRLGCPRQGRGPEETVRVALDQQVKGRRGSVVVAALHPGLTEVEVCVIAYRRQSQRREQQVGNRLATALALVPLPQ